MRTKTTCLALALAFGSSALGSAGCSSNSGSSTEPGSVPIDQSALAREAPSATALTAAVAANNAFALDLYDQVVSGASGGNILTSPFSASLALTMTYAGAKGQTATEMASALGLQGDATATFDGENALSQAVAGRAAAALAFAQQNGSLGGGAAPSPEDYQVQVVNSVWGEKTYPWASPFLGVLAQSYGTGVYLQDFVGNPSGATSTINGWVSDQTAGKIVNLLPNGSITADTRIVLVNAVHLKLPWASPFVASQTATGTFTRGDGVNVSPSFMHQSLEAAYAETDQAQVVSLPLAGNGLSVVFALPKSGLASLVSSLTPTTWAAMMSGQIAGVTLSLPKFTFTTDTFSLLKPLEALGMKTAFTPAADFTGLCASPPDGDKISLSDVLQKAMLAVTETGVEAAAATAVIGLGSAAPSKQVTLSFDQPFLVSIVDASGAILFLGQIDDPTNAGSQ